MHKNYCIKITRLGEYKPKEETALQKELYELLERYPNVAAFVVQSLDLKFELTEDGTMLRFPDKDPIQGLIMRNRFDNTEIVKLKDVLP